MTQPKHPMNRTVVYIRWADTHMSDGGWIDLANYEDDGECLIDTVGFLIPLGDKGSKKGHISVWQTLGEDEGIHGVHIPVGMVRHIAICSPDQLG